MTISGKGITATTETATSDIVGTSTNNDAAAGFLGEYVSSTVLVGSAVALTTATAANIASISLTAGDWDVQGNVAFTANAATTATLYTASISTTSATLPTAPGSGATNISPFSVGAGATQPILPTGSVRLSLAATTTVYLIGVATFAVNSMSGYGFIGARRAR